MGSSRATVVGIGFAVPAAERRCITVVDTELAAQESFTRTAAGTSVATATCRLSIELDSPTADAKALLVVASIAVAVDSIAFAAVVVGAVFKDC
jgi:hypothetical protein